MPRVDDILAGARAQADGQQFESTLDRTHAAYRDYGLARIDRMPVPTAPAGQLRGYRLPRQLYGMLRVLTKRQGFDYYGTFGPNAGPRHEFGRWFGLSIAMEAKSTAEAHSSLRIIGKDGKGGGIRIHQLDALADSYLDFGVISVVVWRNGPDRLVLLPPAVALARDRFRAGGRKSVPVAEFTSFDVVPYDRYPVVEDWLYTVRGWLESVERPCSGMSRLRDFPMINYRVNEAEKSVTAFDENGNETLIEGVMMDLQMINTLATQCSTVDEFQTKVKAIEPANE
jgi:hypothetical protein